MQIVNMGFITALRHLKLTCLISVQNDIIINIQLSGYGK